MPDNSAATLLAVVLGFAHDAISNDTAWDAIFTEIKAKQPDAREVQGDNASTELRASVHNAIHATMAALAKAELQMSQLSRPAFPGSRGPSALPAPVSDPELDAVIARQYL